MKKTSFSIGKWIAAWLLMMQAAVPLMADEFPAIAPGTAPILPPPPGAYRGMPIPPVSVPPQVTARHDDAVGLPPVPPPFAGVRFTDTQRKAIAGIMAGEREAHQQRISRMQQAQIRLNELFSAEEWNSEAILAVYDVIFSQQRDTIKAMSRARNRIYAMMSDEQKAQMRQAQQQRMEGAFPSPSP